MSYLEEIKILVDHDWGTVERDIQLIDQFRDDKGLSRGWAEQITAAIVSAGADGLSREEALAAIAYVSEAVFPEGNLSLEHLDLVNNIDPQFRSGFAHLVAHMDSQTIPLETYTRTNLAQRVFDVIRPF